MNRSWNKNSSPGFVYFNADSPKPPGDTEDFLSFQESPSSNNYSSNYNNGHSSPSYGSPKFHSSPRKFNNKNAYRYAGGNRGNRSFHSVNNSFNNSWSNQRSPKVYNNRQNSNNSLMMSRDGTRDMSMFYDHTSTQNPWEHLEKELEVEKSKEVKDIKEEPPVNKSESSKVEEKEEEEESSSSDSEEGESGSSSSSSCSSSNANNEKEDSP